LANLNKKYFKTKAKIKIGKIFFLVSPKTKPQIEKSEWEKMNMKRLLIFGFSILYYIIASVFDINYFYEHFHAFEVKSNDKKVIIDINQMPDFYPVSI
jgi:hypothetical protein